MNTTEIFTSELPVGEKLSIRRTRFEPQEKSKNKVKRISIVSGIHGDELEGQLVIYLLAEWLNNNSDNVINGLFTAKINNLEFIQSEYTGGNFIVSFRMRATSFY